MKDFDQLMAEAFKIAREQDAKLAERCRKRELEEQKQQKAEQAAVRLPAKRSAPMATTVPRTTRERKIPQVMSPSKVSIFPDSKSKQEQGIAAKRSPLSKASTASNKNANPSRRNSTKNASSVAAAPPPPENLIPLGKPGRNAKPTQPRLTPQEEKRKAAQLSFDELMRKASQMPMKRSDADKAKKSNSGDKANNTNNSGDKANNTNSSTNNKKNNNVVPQVSGKRPPKCDVTPSLTKSSPITTKTDVATKPTVSIYQKRINVPPKGENKPKPSTGGLSVREKIRRMAKEPPQKLNVVKRDLRGVNEIQREIRHKKGIFSDDEDERDDPRVMNSKKRRVLDAESSKVAAERSGRVGGKTLPPPPSSSSTMGARREVHGENVRRERVGGKTIPKSVTSTVPPKTASAATIDPAMRRQKVGGKRPPGTTTTTVDRPIRMPFMRPRAPPAPRRSRSVYEEEMDEDMQSFIVDDEEEDENDYSAEIGRIFRYDRKRYHNEAFSDDDMEADAREVLREEKRSARLGRKEDLEEERREMERIKRQKTKGKSSRP